VDSLRHFQDQQELMWRSDWFAIVTAHTRINFSAIRFVIPDCRRPSMHISTHLQPIVAIIAGVLILIMPRLLNFIVAIYLILVGIIGLGLIK
jgi:hypothetical protein